MSRDTNFYYSFLALPPEKRRALIAIWDFCRAVDDAADECEGGATGGAAAAGEIAAWRRELARVFEGSAPETPQGAALLPFVRRFNLPREPFEALVEGVEMDLAVRRYESFDELYQYCIRVASAVGLICVEVFGYSDPRAREYATDLGVALQLTNILRDVPEDLRRGRLYIPLEDMRAHGCTEDDLRHETAHAGAGVRSPAVKALLRQQAQRAREYYGRAARSLPRGDVRRLVAAQIMGAVYLAILRRIEQLEYDVFSQVVRIPRPRRAVIAAATWVRALLYPGR